MKLRQNDLCDVCKEKDVIEHFFYSCKRLDGFWNYVSSTIYSLIGISIQFTLKTILFGMLKNDIPGTNKESIEIINHFILLGKMAVSKLRYGKQNNIKCIFDNDWTLRHSNNLLQCKPKSATVPLLAA